MPIKKNCERCGKEFMARTYAVKQGNGRFCSRSCKSKAQHNHHTSVVFDSLDQEAFKRAWLRMDISSQKIADTLGVKREYVSLFAQKLGLPSRAGNTECRKRGTDSYFKELWKAGVSLEEMRVELGYKACNGVSVRRGSLGLPVRGRGFKPTPISVFKARRAELAIADKMKKTAHLENKRAA